MNFERLADVAQHGERDLAAEVLAELLEAREHVHGRAVSLPAVTGARGPRVLGALYPAG